MKTTQTIKTALLSILTIFSGLFSAYAEAPNNVIGDVELSVKPEGIEVSWQGTKNTNGTPVDHYRVYVDAKSIEDSEKYSEYIDTSDNITTLVVKSFKETPFILGQSYYFSVTAINSEGEESTGYSQESTIIFTEVNTVSDEELLQLTSVEAKDKNTVIVNFNKEVKIPENSTSAFVIQSNSGERLKVLSVETQENGTSVRITTEDQAEMLEYTVTAFSSVTDLSGIPIVSGVTDYNTFIGMGDSEEVLHKSGPVLEENGGGEVVLTNEEVINTNSEVEGDKTPPEDVTNLSPSYRLNEGEKNYIVDLNWTASKNSAGDLDYQNYRYQVNNEELRQAIKIEKDKTSYQTVLNGGKRYTFKISTVDNVGNESVGSLTSIILPATGPALLLGITGIISALGAGYVNRRKKK